MVKAFPRIPQDVVQVVTRTMTCQRMVVNHHLAFLIPHHQVEGDPCLITNNSPPILIPRWMRPRSRCSPYYISLIAFLILVFYQSTIPFPQCVHPSAVHKKHHLVMERLAVVKTTPNPAVPHHQATNLTPSAPSILISPSICSSQRYLNGFPLS